ncbi:hypothetical protein GCM10023192_39180 [Amycolatopsis samaneae]
MSWFDAFAYGPFDRAKGIRLPPMIATLRIGDAFLVAMDLALSRRTESSLSHCNLLGSRLDFEVTQPAREATDG